METISAGLVAMWGHGLRTDLLVTLEHVQPPALQRLARFRRLIVLEKRTVAVRGLHCVCLRRQQPRRRVIRLSLVFWRHGLRALSPWGR